MRQWNNVTDDTLEVDRDQDRIRAQEETSESGLFAPQTQVHSEVVQWKKRDPTEYEGESSL